MSKKRVAVPSALAADVMFASDSTCCVCRERGKYVQIHHLDEDPGNNHFKNLAVLCLECHNSTQISGGFGRKLTGPLVVKYRDEWLKRVVARRDAADREAIERMSGTKAELPVLGQPYEPFEGGSHLVHEVPDIIRYVDSLHGLRSTFLGRAQPEWDSGVSSRMVQGSYGYIDSIQGILVRLSDFYPERNFGEDARRFFSELIASRFRWHRAILEPDGPGSGGSIVNVLCTGHVMHDVEEMVEQMVSSLTGAHDTFDLESWRIRWRG